MRGGGGGGGAWRRAQQSTAVGGSRETTAVKQSELGLNDLPALHSEPERCSLALYPCDGVPNRTAPGPGIMA